MQQDKNKEKQEEDKEKEEVKNKEENDIESLDGLEDSKNKNNNKQHESYFNTGMEDRRQLI